MTFQKGHKIYLGRKHSEETKKKISIANRGRIFSNEWRKNLSNAHKGQVSWCKGKKLVDPQVSKEKRRVSLKIWKLKNRDKLLLQSRASYKRNIVTKQKASREFYRNNRQKELDRIRLKKYGITGEEFRLTVKKQNGQCLICGETIGKNLSVDHDHATGKIRGIICNNCNLAIGNAKSSPKILRAAANYLEQYE